MIRVLKRGDVRTPGPVVGPGTVPIVEGVPGRFDLPPDAPEGERRAALARWLADPRNPLTWRSIVNRVWQYHFGRGLVDSPNDFGRMGRTPSHPELLDWLAAEFRDGGQSFKALHRLIVTSAAYRQSSAGGRGEATVDGDNVLLWRMNRRRLEAEAVRDSVLMVAGRLDPTPGGPGFRDFVVERPEHSPHYEYRLADPEDPRSHRRSVYRFIVRSQPQPFLTAMDSPTRRERQQAEREHHGAPGPGPAQRPPDGRDGRPPGRATRAEPGEIASRIDRAFRLALARPPCPRSAGPWPAHPAVRPGRRVPDDLDLNEFVFAD